jgi:hypothetical protein
MEKMWTEVVIVHSRHYPGSCLKRLKETTKKTSVIIVGVLAKIQLGHHLHTNQKCYHLSKLAWFELYYMMRILLQNLQIQFCTQEW